MTHWALLLLCCTALGCQDGGSSKRAVPGNATGPPRRDARPPSTSGKSAAKHPTTLNDPVSLFTQGEERPVEAAWAKQQGYVILDLGDDYTPYPFTEEAPKGQDVQVNSYRKRYLDLANNRTDRDGRPLAPGEENHLELYGIPPTLGVLRQRFLRDERQLKACYDKIDRSATIALDRSIHYQTGKARERRFVKNARSWKAAVDRLLRRHGLGTIAEAERRRLGLREIRAHRRADTRLRALTSTQGRLICEGLRKNTEPIAPGVVNWNHHRAMVRFEKKHMIFGWGQIWGKTKAALTRSPLENNHRALLRVLAERIATGLPVIEDGSVPAVLANAGRAGHSDHIGRRVTILAGALGVDTPSKALRFFEHRGASYFHRRRVAVRFPPLPAYYAPHMDLRVVIDRGDVWYDFPYDEQGRPIGQPIARRPRLTLYTTYKGARLPLVRWSTTIGGWRTEVHRGCHYWKYKNSEVGDRVWKFLVAGPVWLPPPGTPPRSLLSKRLVGGRERYQRREWEIGPGYQSAYGLVMALHTREARRKGKITDDDGGIRTHGSADYMSIQTRHSHGCHRLQNHLAIRLITFLLRHRRHVRIGEIPIRWNYNVSYRGRPYSFRRSHKGYYYRLDPPVWVQVTRGRVLGAATRPITRFVRKAELTDAAQSHCPVRPTPRAQGNETSPPRLSDDEKR